MILLLLCVLLHLFFTELYCFTINCYILSFDEFTTEMIDNSQEFKLHWIQTYCLHVQFARFGA